MKGRAFAAVVLSALLLLSGLGIGGWWLLWQRGPLQLAHHPLTLPRAARFVPASASFSLYLFSDGQRPVDYARAVAPARQRRPAGEAIARLRDGAFAAAGLDYQAELAGWLGGDIAMALFEDPVAAATGAGLEQPARGWLLALASRDDDGARRFLQRFWQTRSLAGKDLQVSRYRGMGLISGRGALVGSQPEPLATALVDDDLVLIGSGRNLLERALDVSQIPELNQAGQPLLREGVAAFGSGAALAVASPQALQNWLGLPAPEPAQPVALSQAAAAAKGLPRMAALAAALPDLPDSGSPVAQIPGGSTSPSALQSIPAAADTAPLASDTAGAQAGNAAPAGEGPSLERSGPPRPASQTSTQNRSAAPAPEAVASSPAPAPQSQASVRPSQDASARKDAPPSTGPGSAPLPSAAAAQSSPETTAKPAAGPAPADVSLGPASRTAVPSDGEPASEGTARQAPVEPLPVSQQTAPQPSAAERSAAPSPPPPSTSRSTSPPTGAAPLSRPPAAKPTPPMPPAPSASPSGLNTAAAPSLLAVLQPQGRQLELRARLLLPGAPRLTPVQPELAEALLAALRGSPSSLALIQDPAALERQPLLRPLLQRSLGLRPEAQAERQGPLPALLARSIHGPLLASQAQEGWQLATRAGDPAAVDLQPLLSQAGLLEAPLSLDGRTLRVWTHLSPPSRSGRSGRAGADVLVAPLAGWSESRQPLAWWGQTLAALDAPAETRALLALRRGLRELEVPQAPLQWSVNGDAARALLRAWQPWRLLSALAGGGLDGPVSGLALAVESPSDLAGLELRARLSLGA